MTPKQSHHQLREELGLNRKPATSVFGPTTIDAICSTILLSVLLICCAWIAVAVIGATL